MSFIGQKEIASIDNNVVKFVDGTEKTYTETQLKYLVTEESKDHTALQDIIWENVFPDMYVAFQSKPLTDTVGIAIAVVTVMEDHDIRKGDIKPLLEAIQGQQNKVFEAIGTSYAQLFSNAMGKAFGTYDETRPFDYYEEDIRISDMKRVNNL